MHVRPSIALPSFPQAEPSEGGRFNGREPECLSWALCFSFFPSLAGLQEVTLLAQVARPGMLVSLSLSPSGCEKALESLLGQAAITCSEIKIVVSAQRYVQVSRAPGRH